MKTEDLKEQGLTDEQIQYVMKEYGKDVKKLQKGDSGTKELRCKSRRYGIGSERRS